MDKSREIFWLFIFANVNLLLTATAAATQMEDRCARLILSYLPFPCLDKSEQPLPFYQDIRYSTEFLLVVCLPALMLHILGGGLLILFYKTCHPWRELGWEREAHCFGKLGKIGNQVTVETPYWCEDDSYKQKDIREEESEKQENTKENVRQCNSKDPDVQNHIMAPSVQEHNVQDEFCFQEHTLQEHDNSRQKDIQEHGTRYKVVWKRDEECEDSENILFSCHKEIDLFGQSRRLVQVENILPNKEDEMSRL